MTSAAPKVRFDGFHKCFFKGDQRISGLIPLLTKRFYPHYSFTKATLNKEDSETTEYRQRQEKKKKHRRAIGVDIGLALDRQITRTVKIFNLFPNASVHTFTSRALLQESGMPQWAKEECKNLLPQTYSFWKAMEALKLRPVETQLAVEACHKGRYYATAVDVVCIDKNGDYVLVECKSGFTGYYTRCTEKYMKAPLQQRTDSLANQHQLQLAATREMFEFTYPEKRVASSIILHFEGAKVSCYNLKPWAQEVKSWANLLFSATK